MFRAVAFTLVKALRPDEVPPCLSSVVLANFGTRGHCFG